MEEKLQVQIDWDLYQKLKKLGILGKLAVLENMLEYNLNPWDADIIKRVLRTKKGESRESDYNKIIHDCKERLRQINEENEAKI